jgi:hypothetical protein
LRDPAAHRHPDFATVHFGDGIRDRRAEAVTYNPRLLERRAGQDDRKFLPTVTSKEVMFTQPAAGDISKPLQNRIAGSVAVQVVDALEMVEIKQGNTTAALFGRMIYREIELLVKRTPVGDPRQLVGQRGVLEPLLKLLAVSDVSHGAYDTRHRAVIVSYCTSLGLEPPKLSQCCACAKFDRYRFRGISQRFEVGGSDACEVGAVGKRGRAPAEHLFWSVASDLADGWLRKADLPVDVEVKDDVGRVFGKQTVPRLAVVQAPEQ